MLRFYGIRFNHEGLPERYTVTFALNESLNACLYINDYYQGNLKQTKKAINEEINNLYQKNEYTNGRSFRFVAAKWFRARDIIQFLYSDDCTRAVKLETARILNSANRIEQKWDSIQSVLLTYLSALTPEQREEELSHPESGINLILQMVGLFFMEQDEEVPPANLELQFIRSQFPKIIWKKKEGLNASSNPFWLPKNRYCRPAYLLTRLISTVYESMLPVEVRSAALFPGVKHRPRLTSEKLLQIGTGFTKGAAGSRGAAVSQGAAISDGAFSFQTLYPPEQPDEINLEMKGDNDEGQLTLIPETPAETLLSLQRLIQKRFSYDGVKHLLAIFRQLAEAEPDRIFSFDLFRHLKLVARAAKDGQFSKRQRTLFVEVYRLLRGLNIKRTWNHPEQKKEVTNPLLLELGMESTQSEASDPVKKLLLDPVFFPSAKNPLRLGTHLTLIPNRLFKESAHKHSMLAGLSAFLTGCWLNEFSEKNGVAEKTSREIIEGCGFNVTPANKYRITDKLKSELEYMDEKCYVSNITYTDADNGNPWDDVFQVSAPQEIISGIATKIKSLGGYQTSERLIA